MFDCAAVPPTLIEAELFGHEKGAFTGATERRAGVFERADGGTVFLDELGELALELQPKLLRVLESNELFRVGAAKPTPIDARIVAATNRDLAARIDEGQFREDLYYRLAVVTVRHPALARAARRHPDAGFALRAPARLHRRNRSVAVSRAGRRSSTS